MMDVNKRSAFENWLAAYGSHLEQLAAARLSTEAQDGKPSQGVRDPEKGEQQEH